MIIYHGSEDIINNPEFKYGKPNNDFGRGFYCTCEIEKAKEWACKNNNNGYVNSYSLCESKLKILDLTNNEYSVLNWISILLKNRTFDINTELAKQAKQFLLDHYYINTKKYDLVIGYRADDSYFSYAQSFIENSLSINNLKKAMELGDLGKQIVLVSQKAFTEIEYIDSKLVDAKVYFQKFKSNDIKARQEYKKLTNVEDDEYIIDIMRKHK